MYPPLFLDGPNFSTIIIRGNFIPKTKGCTAITIVERIPIMLDICGFNKVEGIARNISVEGVVGSVPYHFDRMVLCCNISFAMYSC